ncbi:hypothetical protein SASPL_147281 [Salvia splendens]|uniref:Nodulin-like domain-containing protein n=1 Tax=Salvia splendens TaxID=180675 RepID=A0A8X8WE80_SALSN|nr:hypothetical protein SASPL_147281 [Salvia splendens]
MWPNRGNGWCSRPLFGYRPFMGTNLDFFGLVFGAQVGFGGFGRYQLKYLATASDLGKSLGACGHYLDAALGSNEFAAAAMGLVGYGAQRLVVLNICWFNTVCFVLCIKNFPSAMPFALSLTVSFNGVSAALYNLVVKSIDRSSSTVYLLLNALIPSSYPSWL